MTWTPETLAKIKRLQAEAAAAGRDFGALSLAALNKATLAEKEKMSPKAIAAEEARREQINADEAARRKAQGTRHKETTHDPKQQGGPLEAAQLEEAEEAVAVANAAINLIARALQTSGGFESNGQAFENWMTASSAGVERENRGGEEIRHATDCFFAFR